MKLRYWGIVALVALVAIDVVLVVMAIRPKPADAAARTQPTSANAISPSLAPEPQTPTPAPTSAATTSPGLARWVVLNGANVAVSTSGDCATGGAELRTSTDSGTTWQNSSVPLPVVSRMLRNGNNSILVAAELGCPQPQLARESAGTNSWTTSPDTNTVWFLEPQGNGIIGGPAGKVPSPCPSNSIALMPSGGNIALLGCADGQIFRTTDASTWQAVSTQPGLLALAGNPAARSVAAAAIPECTGIAVLESTSNGQNWRQISCVVGAAASGQVGIAIDGANAIVIDGAGATYRSGDGGGSFEKVS